jgi:hypothetical protein
MSSARSMAARLVLVVAGAAGTAIGGGCKSEQKVPAGGVQIIHGPEPDDDRNLVFADVDNFTIPRARKDEIDQIATDFAKGVQGDIAYVRILDGTGPDLTFSVLVYRHR